jgi:hypothetical protein
MAMNLRILSPITRLRGFWVGPIGIVIGLGLLSLGWQWRAHTQDMVAAMLPVEGRVVQMIPLVNDEGKTHFYPIVEFRTAEGRTIRFQGSAGSNPPAHRVGDQVQVRYDSQSPESAVIDSWELWLPSSILIGVGGFFALMGILLILNALAALLQLGGLLRLLGLLGVLLLRRKRSPYVGQDAGAGYSRRTMSECTRRYGVVRSAHLQYGPRAAAT